MHFNKQEHQDQIITTNTSISLATNARDTVKITPTTPSETDRFTSSGDSCTSSTDSGVNVSDTEATAAGKTIKVTPSPPAKPLTVQFHKNNLNNSNEDKKIDNSIDSGRKEDDLQRAKFTRTFNNKFKSEQPLKTCHNSSHEGNTNNHQNSNQFEKAINHKNEALVNNLASHNNEFNEPIRPASPATSSIVYSSDSSDDELPSRQHHFQHHRSPAVSIRSIDSSVIDSDSDSDINGATEGVHKNYVIKKLGTQVSYPPNHPDIPKINGGRQVVTHQITPNGHPNDMVAASPMAILSQIGDNLSNFNPMGQAASVSNVPQIAVSSSKDITIGDKHFYEGPVTIQQFLIDGRDKWKGLNGKDNPTFQDSSGGTSNTAKDINSSPAELPEKSYAKLLKNKKYIIPGALVFTALVILAIVLGIEAANDNKSKNVLGNSEESRKNIPINSTIDSITNPLDPNGVEDVKCVAGKVCMVERDMWGAHPQKGKLDPQTLPLHRVVIAHTASEACNSLLTCRDRVRVIQEFHQNSFGWDDIGYSFLIGSDGRVYVGRGWDDVGAHTKGYNYDSVGIAFIGTYTHAKPKEAQLNACRLLIDEGVRLKKLDASYKLFGARQLGATESPGDALYRIIRTWDHWSSNI